MIIVNNKNIADAPEDIRNLIKTSGPILVLEPSPNGEFGTDSNNIGFSLSIYSD